MSDDGNLLGFAIGAGITLAGYAIATWREQGRERRRQPCPHCRAVERQLEWEAKFEREFQMMDRARQALREGRPIHDTHTH